MKKLTFGLVLICLVGCSRQSPDDRWVDDSLADEAESRYRAAADYSRDHNGLAFLVYERGELVFSAYHDGFTKSDTSLIYSGTKSFSCALAAAAIEDGVIDSYDENVSETLTEWQSDPHKSKITVRHMLHFVTGMEKSFGAINFGFADDKYALAIGREGVHEPGTYYQYDPIHLTTFGAYFLRKSGEDPVDYLQRRVFDPIGLKYHTWKRDEDGHPFLARGANMSAEEWAKFGLLVKDGGKWGSEQVLDEALLNECFNVGPDFPGYGMTWWMNVPLGDWVDRLPNDQVPIDALDAAHRDAMFHPNAPADLVAAAGHNDNRLYISREADLVIVRMGDGDRHFRDAHLLELIFPE